MKKRFDFQASTPINNVHNEDTIDDYDFSEVGFKSSFSNFKIKVQLG